MRIATPSAASPVQPPRDLIAGEPGSPVATSADPRYAQFKVIRRNGAVVGFEPAKITIAMTKAFLAVNGGQGASSARVRDEVARLTDAVVAALMKRKPDGGAIHIEEIQDQVELALMRGGEHEVARAYVLYREKRAQERAQDLDVALPDFPQHPTRGLVHQVLAVLEQPLGQGQRVRKLAAADPIERGDHRDAPFPERA